MGQEILLEMLREKAEPVVNKFIALAEEGDMSAIKEFFERLFGKVKNPIELSGGLKLKELTEFLRNNLNSDEPSSDSQIVSQRPSQTALSDSRPDGDIQPDSVPETPAPAPDGTYAIRKEFDRSSGGTAARSDFPGEVGDSSSQRSEGQDNNGILDPAHL